MRRSAAVTLALLTTLAIGEVGVRAVSDRLPDPAPWPTNETELKAEQMASGGEIPIVIIGTSVTEAAIDPAMLSSALGVGVYNAATPFATQQSLRYWTDHFVIPGTAPRVLLVGLPVWSAGFAAAEDDGLLLTGLERVAAFHHPATVAAKLAYWSHLVRWRTELKSLPDLLEPRNRLGDGPWTDLGHQTGHYARHADFSPQRADHPSASRFDFAALVRLVESAESSGAEVVFVFEPATCTPTAVCLTPEDVEVMEASYRGLASDLGVRLIDVPGPWPRDWYADAAHFNRRGTVEFTNRLIPDLAEEL